MLLAEQKWSRILGLRREEKDSLPTLWQPKSASVDDPVSPRVATRLKLLSEPPHRLAAVELQHERDVLQQQPCRLSLGSVEEPENVIHETRPTAFDTCGLPCLAEVLARKACRHEIDGRKGFELSDVPSERDAREPFGQDPPSRAVAFAQENRLVTSLVKADLDTSDPGEEAGNTKKLAGAHGSASQPPAADAAGTLVRPDRTRATIRLSRVAERFPCPPATLMPQ